MFGWYTWHTEDDKRYPADSAIGCFDVAIPSTFDKSDFVYMISLLHVIFNDQVFEEPF